MSKTAAGGVVSKMVLHTALGVCLLDDQGHEYTDTTHRRVLIWEADVVAPHGPMPGMLIMATPLHFQPSQRYTRFDARTIRLIYPALSSHGMATWVCDSSYQVGFDSSAGLTVIGWQLSRINYTSLECFLLGVERVIDVPAPRLVTP